MRPGVLKRALAVLGCGVACVTLAACESTERESAKIAREGGALAAGPGALKLGGINRAVRVSDATLLSDAGRKAVAVRLTSTSTRAQRNLPVLVEVTGVGGKVVYSNELGGVEASLQRMALLRPHQSAWWVDDQVLGSQSTTGVRVRIGTGNAPRSGALRPLGTSGTRVSEQAGLSVLSGKLVNHSGRSQNDVPVYAVAVRGGKVVAAGRAVVSEPSQRAGASVPFQIYMVGDTAGAKIELTAVPTAA
jgi:hypothetical protein